MAARNCSNAPADKSDSVWHPGSLQSVRLESDCLHDPGPPGVVLASSFKRIHRANRVGMGILPIRLPDGVGPRELAVQPGDQVEIEARPERLAP
jgi:hypothetical protein